MTNLNTKTLPPNQGYKVILLGSLFKNRKAVSSPGKVGNVNGSYFLNTERHEQMRSICECIDFVY